MLCRCQRVSVRGVTERTPRRGAASSSLPICRKVYEQIASWVKAISSEGSESERISTGGVKLCDQVSLSPQTLFLKHIFSQYLIAASTPIAQRLGRADEATVAEESAVVEAVPPSLTTGVILSTWFFWCVDFLINQYKWTFVWFSCVIGCHFHSTSYYLQTDFFFNFTRGF